MYGILNAKHASAAFDSGPYMQEWEEMITLLGSRKGKQYREPINYACTYK